MGVWTKILADQTAVSAQQNCIALDLARKEGHLTRLIVQQTSGTLAGFAVDVYCTSRVCPTDESSSSLSGSTQDDYMYRIMPTLTAANTVATAAFFTDSNGYAYNNIDGTNNYRNQGLTMRIVPAGTGTKTFDVTYTTTGP